MDISIPKNMTPKQFFENFLPEHYEKIKDSVDPLPISVSIGIEIEGEDDWVIEFEDGDLSIYSGVPDQPFLTFKFDIDLWNKYIKKGLGTIFIDIVKLDKEGRRYFDQKKIDKIIKMHGKIDLNIDSVDMDGEEIDLSLSIEVGEPIDKDPYVKLNIDQSQFDMIQKGYKNIYQLISSNKINIEGEFKYLMKLATTVIF